MVQDYDSEIGRMCRQISNQLSQTIRILEDAKDKCLRTKLSAFQRIAQDEQMGIQKSIDDLKQIITKVQSL
jgi:DNA-binding FrmR family transcriptional regulator